MTLYRPFSGWYTFTSAALPMCWSSPSRKARICRAFSSSQGSPRSSGWTGWDWTDSACSALGAFSWRLSLFFRRRWERLPPPLFSGTGSSSAGFSAFSSALGSLLRSGLGSGAGALFFGAG